MKRKINYKIIKIIEDTFNVKINDSYEEISSDTIEEWDSLGQINLIMEIEKYFDVKFPTELIPLMDSAEKIQEQLEKMGKI